MIRFQPFQLYPDLKRGDPKGVDKYDFFKELYEMRGSNEKEMVSRFKYLQGAWEGDGLNLANRERGNGRWGNSLDAQRLISFARKQGREDQMIEAIYTANHEKNLPLSDMSVLLECAKTAGVQGASEMLDTDQEISEVVGKIRQYTEMGVTAVPVIIVNETHVINGAPEAAVLGEMFNTILDESPLAAAL